jgi:hypothetical protein
MPAINIDSQLETKGEICFVIPTLGLRNFTQFLVSELVRNSFQVIVVEQSESQDLYSSFDQFTRKQLVFLRVVGERGASRARNVGMRAAPISSEYLMFLNDTFLPNPNFLNQATIILNSNESVGAVFGRYRYQDGSETKSVLGNIGKRQLMAVNESSIMFRRSMLEQLGGFNEAIGTGSDGLIQSGEAADLLIRSLRLGWQVIGVNDIAGTDSRKTPTHTKKVDFLYGVGFSKIARENGLFLWALARVATPILRKIARLPLGDSPSNVGGLLAVVAGRLFGIVVPSTFLDKFKPRIVKK